MYIRLIDSTLRENEYLFRLNDQQKVYYPFFLNFLTKTSEQHKGRILVVVSFFVHFRRISSLTETSLGNEYN